MKSLAYLVAFIFAMVVIGGPLSLGITYIRVRRYKATIYKGVLSILLASVSILLSLVLILNTGAIGSKILGFIGLASGIPAIVRSVRSIGNFR